MKNRTMLIEGNAKSLLYEYLKSHGLKTGEGLVFVRPVLMGSKMMGKAIRGKRKNIEMHLKLALAAEAFNEPETITMLNDPRTVISVSVGIPEKHFTEKGLWLSDDSNRKLDDIFAKHPELGELFNEFVPKWEAAFQRALDKQDAEDAANVH